MKKYGMLAIAAIFMFSMAVKAQDQTPQTGGNNGYSQNARPHATPQMRAERLAKQLSLTDDQKTKVQALFEKQEDNRTKNQAEVNKTKEERRALNEANRKVQDEELAKIIGTDKFQQFQTARAERMQKMQNRGDNVNSGSNEVK